MPVNKIVVHNRKGILLRGTTTDFVPRKPTFHLIEAGSLTSLPREIVLADLKAIFFVKKLLGNAGYEELPGFGEGTGRGRRVRVTFFDGEVAFGYTHVINYELPGFFFFPADPKSNNERIFAVFAAIKRLELDDQEIDVAARRGELGSR